MLTRTKGISLHDRKFTIQQLTTWQFGNLAIWQLGNLATWQEMLNLLSTFTIQQLGNLATWQLSKFGTFNFGYFSFWQLSIQFIKTVDWQEIYKSLSIGNIQIRAAFDFGNFQFNSSKIHTNFQQEILKSLSNLAISNFGNFQFRQFSI